MSSSPNETITPTPAVEDEHLNVLREKPLQKATVAALTEAVAEAGIGASKAEVAGGKGDFHLTVLVIGKVTDSTARVLVEMLEGGDLTVALTCVEKDVRRNKKSGAARKTQNLPAPITRTQVIVAGRPKIFAFEGLEADSRYEVSFGQLAHQQPKSSFKTMVRDWKVNSADVPGMRIATVSCNLLSETRAIKPGHVDLWADLAMRAERGDLDYVLHMGDQVYADEVRSETEVAAPVSAFAPNSHEKEGKGGDELDKEDQLVFAKAQKILKDIEPSGWAEHQAQVEMFYRELYRETWSHRPTAMVLANAPSLMIFDDHDFVDNWGSLPKHHDKTTKEYFIALCARQVYWEYQGSLYRDVDLTNVGAIQDDHHHHVFGEYGFVFTESRGAGSFRWSEADTTPFLGAKQWQDLDAIMAPEGPMKDVKHLVFVCPCPVVYLPHGLNGVLETVVEDALGHWASGPFRAEQTRLLNLALAWQEGKQFGDSLKELQAPTWLKVTPKLKDIDEQHGVHRNAFPSVVGRNLNDIPVDEAPGIVGNVTGLVGNVTGTVTGTLASAASSVLSMLPAAVVPAALAPAAEGEQKDGGEAEPSERKQNDSGKADDVVVPSQCVSDRRFTFVGGDVHVGGHTRLFKHGHLVLEQLVSSAIANHVLPSMAFKIGTMVQNSYTTLLDGWSFEHSGFTRNRNYGLVDTFRSDSGKGKPRATTYIIHAE